MARTHAEPAVRRYERLWLAAAIVAILGLSSLPILAGYRAQTPQARFVGGIFDRQDLAVHLGAMKLGVSGEWAYRFLFTTEDVAPAYTKLGYLILGKAAELSGVGISTFYNASRVLLGAIALVAIYRYLAAAFAWITLRRTAFLLASAASGLGWLMLIVNRMSTAADPPVDLWLIDLYVFYSLSAFPHFAAVIALLIAQGMCYLRFLQDGKLHQWFLAVIAGLAMMPIQPFSVALGDLLAGGAVLATWRHQGRVRRRDIPPLLIMILLQLPYLLYHLQLFRSSAGWAAFAAQNVVLMPHPADLLLGIGLLGPLAAWGAALAWRRRSRVGLVSVVWLLGSLGLSYFPTAIQRRFTLGLTIPLGMLTTFAMAYGLMPWLRRAWPSWIGSRRKMIPMLIVAVSLPTSFYLAIGGAIFVSQRPGELFDPPSLLEAIEWMGRQASPADAVMASERSGWLIPAGAGLRVYVGHPFETLEYERKAEGARAFFDAEAMTAAQREDMLRNCGCDWVIIGPYERELGASESMELPAHLSLSYRKAGISIYHLND